MEPLEQPAAHPKPCAAPSEVEDCISQYSAIVRGAVPKVITDFFDQIEFRKEQMYDNQGSLLRGQFEETIFKENENSRKTKIQFTFLY